MGKRASATLTVDRDGNGTEVIATSAPLGQRTHAAGDLYIYGDGTRAWIEDDDGAVLSPDSMVIASGNGTQNFRYVKVPPFITTKGIKLVVNARGSGRAYLILHHFLDLI